LKTYSLKLMMIEVRNDAGKKVAVEPLSVSMGGNTPQEAVAAFGLVFTEALQIALQQLQRKAAEEQQAAFAKAQQVAAERGDAQG